ncbi:MAG: ATP:cob(I)alamin adenosyltransferase [Verrucomicrobiota bacterium]
MSIATRTGDSGTTGLMYNRRVSKAHPRVEAYGSVDELNLNPAVDANAPPLPAL